MHTCGNGCALQVGVAGFHYCRCAGKCHTWNCRFCGISYISTVYIHEPFPGVRKQSAVFLVLAPHPNQRGFSIDAFSVDAKNVNYTQKTGVRLGCVKKKKELRNYRNSLIFSGS